MVACLQCHFSNRNICFCFQTKINKARLSYRWLWSCNIGAADVSIYCFHQNIFFSIFFWMFSSWMNVHMVCRLCSTRNVKKSNTFVIFSSLFKFICKMRVIPRFQISSPWIFHKSFCSKHTLFKTYTIAEILTKCSTFGFDKSKIRTDEKCNIPTNMKH